MISEADRNGWWVAGFFGLGIPISVLQLVPGTSYLRLEPTSFTCCSLYRKSTIQWKDVQAFGTWIAPRARTKMVCFNLRPECPKYKVGRKFSRVISGWDREIPDTYGKSAEELVELMEEWRLRRSR